MPTYLLHGFRWLRSSIRIHIILQNLDDCAAEWLIAPPTSRALLQNLTELYPTLIPLLPSLRFVEQYDPADESVEAKSQPFAYVADSVHEVKLGEDVSEVMGRGIKPETWDAIVELRDHLEPKAQLSWFVVVCGDVERWAPPTSTLASMRAAANGAAPNKLNGSSVNGGGGHLDQDGGAPHSAASAESQSRWSKEESRPSTSRSIKKFFGEKVLRKTKSMKSLRKVSNEQGSSSLQPPVPPIPQSISLQPPSTAA